MYIAKFSKNFFILLGRKASIAFVSTMAAGLLLSVVEASFASGFAIVLKLLNTTDAATPFDNYLDHLGTYKWMTIAILPCLALVRAILLWSIEHGCSTVEEILRGRLRQLAMYRLLISENDRYLAASEVNNLNATVFNSAILFIFNLGSLFAFSLTSLGLLGWIFYIKPFESIFAVLGILFIGIIFSRINKKVSKIMQNQIILSSKLNSTTNRIAQNSLFIRCSNLQEQELLSASETNGTFVSRILKARALSSFVNLVPTVLGISLITVLLYFQIKTGSNADSMNFISMIYIMMRLVEALSRTSKSISTLLPLNIFFVRTMKFFFESDDHERSLALTPFHNRLNAPQDKYFSSSIKIDIQTCPPPPSIEIRNLRFKFKSNGKELYNGLSFTLGKGEQLGIVGSSGSGKSTLLSLILGITKTTTGQILINGGLDYSSLRIGFVSAEPFLFSGTLKENMDYGQTKHITKSQYYKVLTDVMLLRPGDDLDALLSRTIREDLTGMSMGEKQRLCFARALLREPNIIILDEATSNLDVQTEAEIVGLLTQLRGIVTIIFVSHRINALKGADHILDVESGETISFSKLKERSQVA
jgi:ABC-type multidrug transport system fused ATPase/permease subunit